MLHANASAAATSGKLIDPSPRSARSVSQPCALAAALLLLADRDRDAPRQRLIDDAVALRGRQQLLSDLGARWRLELEAHLDPAKADRRVAVHSQRAAEIELPLSDDTASGDGDPAVEGHRAQGDASARHQRLEQHVA